MQVEVSIIDNIFFRFCGDEEETLRNLLMNSVMQYWLRDQPRSLDQHQIGLEDIPGLVSFQILDFLKHVMGWTSESEFLQESKRGAKKMFRFQYISNLS